MIVAQALADAAARLAAISDTSRLDAELLMAAAAGIDRDQLLLNPPGEVPPGFGALLARRLGGEPIAYILGRRAFWTIELEVGPGVLIPRPDSETLLEAAVRHFAGGPGPRRILDLGTGPGTLLLAALDQWRQATGIGIDRSPTALDYARRNAQWLGAADRAEFRLGNWGTGLAEEFDLVLANPPYVATSSSRDPGLQYEPAQALFAGADGLDAYRVLIPQLPLLLSPGGLAAIEIGFDQADAVLAMVDNSSLRSALAYDLAGRPRACLLRRR